MASKSAQFIAPLASSEMLYTPKEAFATLSVGNTKGWELIAEGHLKVVRLGRRCTRVKGSSIDHLVKNGVPN